MMEEVLQKQEKLNSDVAWTPMHISVRAWTHVQFVKLDITINTNYGP
jgi:hypothetical protein